ncbi:helix-turn-helix domain-containing protein [Cyanobacterium sp. uoEpiScrs1]|uniref:helix-turn-helix domain-containing protein n=1 Tax=Cyanobacterium sp. uoEpiScrs1 TaxID=2976343 RepID=UPI00226A7518|nr:helix-turn-helix domain-containing protein [Cyanobacterium sp. uoEpiScrs1]
MSNYNSSQIQQLRELGAYLCQQRLDQSLTLEQISTSTFINLSVLQALEQGLVDQLPELIYVQGFVRRYGETLSLDGHSLANQLLPQRIEESSPKISSELAILSPIKSLRENFLFLPLVGIQTTVNIPKKAFYFLKNLISITSITSEKALTIPILLPHKLRVYGFILVSLGAITGLFHLFSVSQSSKSFSQKNISEVVTRLSIKAKNLENQKPKTVSTSNPNATSEAKKISQKSVRDKKEKSSAPTVVNTNTKENNALNKNNSTSNLELDAPVAAAIILEGDSWIRVKIDGKIEYEGILRKGTQQTWTAQKSLTIRAGNAGAIGLAVNNQPSQKLGNIGEVQEVTLTANN